MSFEQDIERIKKAAQAALEAQKPEGTAHEYNDAWNQLEKAISPELILELIARVGPELEPAYEFERNEGYWGVVYKKSGFIRQVIFAENEEQATIILMSNYTEEFKKLLKVQRVSVRAFAKIRKRKSV